MGKFKVGDRVRRVTRSDWPSQFGEVGSEYTVLEVPSEHLITVISGSNGAMANAFEIVAASPTITIETGKHYRLRNGKVTGRVTTGDIGFEALVDGQVKVFDKAGGAVFGGEDIVEAWVPKVGERVRFVRDSEAGGARYGYEGESATVSSNSKSDFEGKAYLSVRLDGGRDRLEFTPSTYLDDLEPLLVAAPAQPAVLTIQQGKFYKTRDGRKVGPIGPNEGGLAEYPWQDNSDWTDCWTTDGRFYNDGTKSQHDIVAEWVDEPVAASNDNVAPAKFKVGDAVRRKEWLPGFYDVTKIEGEHFWIKVSYGDDLKYQIEGGEWIVQTATPTPTAIVALIEDGAAKPSSKPKVHDSHADATAEAERLALAHPGQLFGVFVLADSKIADVVNVPTPVLRAA